MDAKNGWWKLGFIITLTIVLNSCEKKDLKEERSILIKAPLELVYGQLIEPKNLVKWYLKNSVTHKMEWDSANPSSTRSITWSEAGNRKNSLTLQSGEKLKYVWYKGDENGAKTTNRWDLQNELIGTNVIFKKTLNSNTEQSKESISVENEEKLVALNKYCEELMQKEGVEFKVLKEQSYLTIRAQFSAGETEGIHRKLYGEIAQYMYAQGVSPRPGPIATYYKKANSSKADSLKEKLNVAVDIEAGIPVDTVFKDDGRIKYRKMSKRKVLVISHFGPYDDLEKSYLKMTNFMNKYGIATIGAPWEKYVTDPNTQPDVSKWETRIYFPIN